MPFDAESFIPAKVDPKSLTTPRERLIYLRDFLRDLPATRFDMQNWAVGSDGVCTKNRREAVEDCGTKACICGWTVMLFGAGNEFVGDTDLAGEELGLSWAQANTLFEPLISEDGDDLTVFIAATPTQAAAVLTHLIETGEVDWTVAQ